MRIKWSEQLEILKDILSEYFETHGQDFTHKNFERIIGAKRGRGAQILSKGQTLHYNELVNLGLALNLSADWLLYGKEPLRNPDKKKQEARQLEEDVELYGDRVTDIIIKVTKIYETPGNLKNALITTVNSLYLNIKTNRGDTDQNHSGGHCQQRIMPAAMDNTGFIQQILLT